MVTEEINVDEILGQQINVATTLTNATVGTGIVSGGTVLETCSAENASDECIDTTDYVVDQSVSIVNGPLRTGAQWRSVARSLQVALILKNAYLTQDITVTQES